MKTLLYHVSRAQAPTTLALIAVMFLALASRAQETGSGRWPAAPPPAVTFEVEQEPIRQVRLLQAAEPALYSIGEPTAEEQLYLELINRARLDPTAEGLRLRESTDPDVVGAIDFFGVDLDLMEQQFQALESAPPLAMNARITTAARRHSQDMFDNQFQDHTGTDGSTTATRLFQAGYIAASGAENVYANAGSVWAGHAGFQIDWGIEGQGIVIEGGMQTPPGHRVNIHKATFREVGIGIVSGMNGPVGPQVVTQDFGTAVENKPFLTGVAYYDLNGNEFYDPGEGIGGVTITVSGAAYYAVTAGSGGYAVPLSGSGEFTATFSGAGFASVERPFTVTSGANVKIDFTPDYVPPSITGSSMAGLGRSNVYSVTAVGGAESYEWVERRLAPWLHVEGAETGAAHVTVSASAGYEVFNTAIKASGERAFHLAHPTAPGAPPEDQVIQFKRPFRIRTGSEVTFQSWMGVASLSQTASLQASLDDGATWTLLWSQTGDSTGVLRPPAFAAQSVDLSAYAGQAVLLRFVYAVPPQSPYFDQTSDRVGFYLDDIQIHSVDTVAEEHVHEIVDGILFEFQPEIEGEYLLSARAKLAAGFLPWSPARLVSAQTLLPVEIEIVTARSQGAEFVVEFNASNADGQQFELVTAASVNGPWTPQMAVLVPPTAAEPFQFRLTPPAGAVAFFRVRTGQ